MKVSERGKFQVNVDHIGHSGQPVIVIDDFLINPEDWVSYATSGVVYRQTSQFYPGIRAESPIEYRNTLKELLPELICEVFGWKSGQITESSLSLVTKLPAELSPGQQIPHFDFTDPNMLAILHYLCRPEHGGTSFYRHRRTGYELILANNVDHYLNVVNTEIRFSGTPAKKYMNGDTELFQSIANYQAIFNRVLIYRGALLHSGSIPGDFVPDIDPRKGRLTINTFVKR